MKYKKLLLFIFLPFLISCSETTPHTITINSSENEPVVIYTPREVDDSILQVAWSHLKEGNKWTKFTQEAIRDYGQDLLHTVPRDIKNYCPNYVNLSTHKRGDFWVHLISKLAYFESSYNPEETYQERFPDNNGDRVISRGLLQLSIESANGNYNCGLSRAEELHDPKTNLECAVRILNQLVVKDGVIANKYETEWRGASRYWSPFRHEEKNRIIFEYTNALVFCHI